MTPRDVSIIKLRDLLSQASLALAEVEAGRLGDAGIMKVRNRLLDAIDVTKELVPLPPRPPSGSNPPIR